MITLAALILTSAYAHEFPSKQVEYTCRIAPYYVTTPADKCILEQYAWFSKASMSEHYESALWYGQRNNWRGEVVGIDFKPVLERIEYLLK